MNKLEDILRAECTGASEDYRITFFDVVFELARHIDHIREYLEGRPWDEDPEWETKELRNLKRRLFE